MNISANTLFHFTQSLENLISILSHNFFPRLCLECNTIYEEPYDKMAIPMVCFCDIPLGNITSHMKNYGQYAIGLKKKWAQKKGLNPVMYVNAESTWMDTQRGVFYELTGMPENRNILDLLIYQQAFIKEYKGKQIINGKEKNLCFYDEREWRYVPEMLQDDDRYFLSGLEFYDTERRRGLNEKLAQLYPLSFTPNDINYIIVKKDSELLAAKFAIENIKKPFYSQDDVELLCTKLISAERIKEDF